MTDTQKEITELLDADIREAGDSLDRLRLLETDLEAIGDHPLVRSALREISSKIFALEIIQGG